VREYLGYTIDEPLQNSAHMLLGLRELLDASPAKGKVAVEEDILPAVVGAALAQMLPAASLVRCDGDFDRLRAVKSAEEIERLRKSVSLCDRAQDFVRRNARVGMREIELWGALKADLEVSVGGRVPILVDLVGGGRTAEVGGLPGEYRLQPGDPLLLDIVPRLDGYWGDNTDTHAVGDRGSDLDKVYRVVRSTLRRAVEAVRPGLKARDLDAQMRGDIQRAGYPVYPHHSGHGLGASYHEEPRIVPYNDLPLEPGMVIALEPGVYLPGVGGVRLEDVVLVRGDGCEVLTTHLRDE
jgi:Xaa-Pro dipeptidase